MKYTDEEKAAYKYLVNDVTSKGVDTISNQEYNVMLTMLLDVKKLRKMKKDKLTELSKKVNYTLRKGGYISYAENFNVYACACIDDYLIKCIEYNGEIVFIVDSHIRSYTIVDGIEWKKLLFNEFKKIVEVM